MCLSNALQPELGLKKSKIAPTDGPATLFRFSQYAEMNCLAITQTTVTGDLGKHGRVSLFPCLNCGNLVLKKCLSPCFEVRCYNDWWLQNCRLQHLECFVTFSFNVSELKGKRKFSVLLNTRALDLWRDSPKLLHNRTRAVPKKMGQAREAAPHVCASRLQKHEAFVNGTGTKTCGVMPFLHRHLRLR